MTGIAIRLSGPQDAARVNDALRRLSAGLGDRHRVDDAALAEAGWGAHPLDLMVWGCDADLSGPITVEGTGNVPRDGQPSLGSI